MARQIDEIGLQVYTVRNALQADWEGTLRKVAEIGYNTVEMGGFYGESQEWFRGFLTELGLKNLSGGGSIGQLETGLDALIAESLVMGREYVVCFWPWSETFTAETPDVWLRIAEKLNEIGKKCKENGLTFAYHNHDIEFVEANGRIAFDVLLENTEPQYVCAEVDIYWMKKGGYEAVDYFAKFPGRFPLWHVKDMLGDEARSFACVGEGIIDFRPIFAQAELAGLKHIFVEQDQPKDEIECIRVSHDNLRALRY